MSRLRFLFGRSRLLWGCALVAFLFSAPSAHASTYSFSFTTQDLLTSLSLSDTNYSEHGYFAIFLQPSTLTGYSFNGIETSPRPAPEGYADDWQAALGTETAFTGQVVEFTRDFNSSSASLVSGANGAPGGENIFLYGGPNTYAGSVPIPTGFGNAATITSIMPLDAVFSFELTTAATSLGPVTFTGEASAIFSGSDQSFDPLKTDRNIGFTLTLDADLVAPEPGTFVLFGAGAACVLAAGVRRKKRPAAGSRS